MKHAYLIIAHNEYPVLETLVSMIDDERNDIYLHIDLRSTELYKRARLLCTQKARLFLLPIRNKVYWGDISQVETEYLLLETKYLCLLSFTFRRRPTYTNTRLYPFFLSDQFW